MHGAHLAVYDQGNGASHDPDRDRKLLLLDLRRGRERSFTLVPTRALLQGRPPSSRWRRGRSCATRGATWRSGRAPGHGARAEGCARLSYGRHGFFFVGFCPFLHLAFGFAAVVLTMKKMSSFF